MLSQVSTRSCRGRSGVCEGVLLTLLLLAQAGDTALIAAARANDTEAVKALIEAGAKTDLQNKVSLLLPPSRSFLRLLPAHMNVAALSALADAGCALDSTDEVSSSHLPAPCCPHPRP